MDVLNIGLVQFDTVWEKKSENFSKAKDLIGRMPGCEIYLLPEMFSTAFSLDPAFAEKEDGDGLDFMRQMAKTSGAIIGGSLMVQDGNTYKNRFYWVRPEGDFSFYDKKYLFTIGGEAKFFTPGTQLCIVEDYAWKIALKTCYDIRFPAWSANAYEQGRYDYDVIIYVASWPELRIQAWKTLLGARAIENMAYSVGVNRIGTDRNGLSYSGHSGAYDWRGNCISDLGSAEVCKKISLNKSELDKGREKFPTAYDWSC